MKRQNPSEEQQKEQCSSQKRSLDFLSNLSKEEKNELTASTKSMLENVHKSEIKNLKTKLQSKEEELRDVKELAEKHILRAEENHAEEKRRADDAIAEVEKMTAKFAQIMKEKDDVIVALQSQLSEISERSKNAKKKATDEIKGLKVKLHDAKKAESEATKREGHLEKRIVEYRQNLKSKDNVIDDLKKTEAKELKKIRFERNEVTSKNESLERSVNEFLERDARQKAEIAELQKSLNEIAQELKNKTLEVNRKIENLQQELNEKQKIYEEKYEELRKNFETELAELEADKTELKNECDEMHQAEMEKLKSAANQEMASIVKEMQEKDAQHEKIKAENAELKGKLENLKKAAEGVAAKMKEMKLS